MYWYRFQRFCYYQPRSWSIQYSTLFWPCQNLQVELQIQVHIQGTPRQGPQLLPYISVKVEPQARWLSLSQVPVIPPHLISDKTGTKKLRHMSGIWNWSCVQQLVRENQRKKLTTPPSPWRVSGRCHDIIKTRCLADCLCPSCLSWII